MSYFLHPPHISLHRNYNLLTIHMDVDLSPPLLSNLVQRLLKNCFQQLVQLFQQPVQSLPENCLQQLVQLFQQPVQSFLPWFSLLRFQQLVQLFQQPVKSFPVWFFLLRLCSYQFQYFSPIQFCFPFKKISISFMIFLKSYITTYYNFIWIKHSTAFGVSKSVMGRYSLVSTQILIDLYAS